MSSCIRNMSKMKRENEFTSEGKREKNNAVDMPFELTGYALELHNSLSVSSEDISGVESSAQDLPTEDSLSANDPIQESAKADPISASSGGPKKRRRGKSTEVSGRKHIPGNKKKRKKRKKKKTILDWVLIVLGILVGIVAVGAAVAFALFSSGRLKLKASVEEAQITGDETEAELKAKYSDIQWQDNWIALDGDIYEYDKDTINLLFLGVDTKGKMKKETDLSIDSTPGQTDAVFVLSINPKRGTVSIIGIPRNGLINIDKYDEDKHIFQTVYDELSLQYPWAGGGMFGIEITKQKVSELLHGIPISGTFALSYDSVPIVNDMVGGVDIEVMEDLTFADEKFVKGAKLHLMGKDASVYTQRRDISIIGSASGRLKRQKQYILELFKQTKDTVKANPIIISDIYNALNDYMLTDVGLDESIYIATQVIQCGFDSDDMFVIKGTDVINVNPNLLDKDGNPREFNDLEYDKDDIKEVVKNVFLKRVEVD